MFPNFHLFNNKFIFSTVKLCNTVFWLKEFRLNKPILFAYFLLHNCLENSQHFAPYYFL
jgi:hypothetical protein